MNRRSFLHAAAVVGAPWVCLSSLTVQATPNGAGEIAHGDPQQESARRIAKAIRAAMSMQRRDWEQGILAQAMLDAGEREYAILLTKAAIVQQTPDGRMAVVVSGGPTDPSMGGVAYNMAAVWTADPQIREAVERMLDWIRTKAPRNAAGILYHVFGAREMWSDGFNCAPPFLAAMGFYDEALKQIDGYRVRLWNPEKKLLAHVWDDEKQEFKDGNFWGGGNGWAAAGLARTIRSLPSARNKDRERLAEFCREIVDGCLAHRRADGLFHDVVDQPATFVETNLAQMLAYAMFDGVSQGWLSQSYLKRAYELRAAARGKMDACGFVQGVCGAPSFDRSGTSTEGQAFCILMEAAGRKVGRTFAA
jgi:rhamnogalacturonyl hydrolase YesR